MTGYLINLQLPNQVIVQVNNWLYVNGYPTNQIIK